MSAIVLLGLVLLAGGADSSRTETAANPVRRVVGMLQMMQKKVIAEGDREKELYEKFQCYCTNGDKELGASIGDAETKAPQLQAEFESGNAEKAQLAQDIVKAKADRDAAKAALAEATGIREKEAGAFQAESDESTATISAITKATAAIERGLSGFIQTATAKDLLTYINTAEMDTPDRDAVASFLSGASTQPSGQVIGILGQMKDTLAANLAETTKAEDNAKADFKELSVAKEKEIAASQAEVEEKTVRLGELKVKLVNLEEDIKDTEKALGDDKQFLKDLEKTCKSKQAEWETRSAIRAEELVAIGDTIKMLNNDDALELFKKTLPSPSLLEMRVSNRAARNEARAALQASKHHDRRLDLISLALHGKKVNFDKVVKMIDDMANLLKDEQEEDDAKKAYCGKELDKAEDEKKVIAREISNLGAAIKKEEEAVATLAKEIEELTTAIAATDKDVADQTEQRKKEHAEYEVVRNDNNAVKQIIGMAKNRLNQFYNPKLATLVQAQVSGSNVEAPAPPPETWGAYQKKGEETAGVISMMDALTADVDKDNQEAKVEEDHAQAEYEQFVQDSATKRASDSALIEEKEGVKAETTGALEKHASETTKKLGESKANDEFIMNLHLECDWLLSTFEKRKVARSGELDSLAKAKAVLSGADFSLVQVQEHVRRVEMTQKLCLTTTLFFKQQTQDGASKWIEHSTADDATCTAQNFIQVKFCGMGDLHIYSDGVCGSGEDKISHDHTFTAADCTEREFTNGMSFKYVCGLGNGF